MPDWIAWLAALVSFSAFLVLWFREVWRMLRRLQSTVDSARAQLNVCRKNASAADAQAQGVLVRSESILRQAVDNYNQALARPWNFLPGHLMGFHRQIIE